MNKSKLLPAIHPNAGIEAWYRRKLLKLIDEMARSYLWFVRAAYKANEPAILAVDASPTDELKAALKKLSDRWYDRFDDVAQILADHFAQDIGERSDAALKAALRKAGFTVKFKLTAVQRDILKASVQQSVSLIKSIPDQFHDQVEGSVMRAVQVGGDLGSLTKELQAHHGVTRRRAAFIARDQNNKAHAALLRSRQLEIGITEAIWVHSAGGKVPRPSHVKAGRDQVRFNVAKGWWDPDEEAWVLPGELINCRCVSRPIIPGLDT